MDKATAAPNYGKLKELRLTSRASRIPHHCPQRRAFGVVNQHLTYALVTAFLGLIGAANYFGLDRSVGEPVSSGIRRWLLSGNPHSASWPDRDLEPMPA